MSTQVLTQKIVKATTTEKMAIFLIKKPGKTKVLDLTTIEWMKKELSCYDIYIIDLPKSGDYKSKIAAFCANYDRIAILPSSLALITKQTMDNCFEIASVKGSKAMKLLSGYTFDAKYYLSTNEYYFDSFYTQHGTDFYNITTPEEITYAERVLSRRIIERLQRCGVVFHNASSCIISANAEIGAGSVIMSNCNITGKTKIGNNCIINNNCSISDSKIADNSSVSNSIISKCNIGKNTIISPYCDLKKTKIGDNALINSYCILDGVTIKKNEKVAERTTIKKQKQEKK